MKTSENFNLDKQIVNIHGRLRKMFNTAPVMELDLEVLLEPGVSSFNLRRRARRYHRCYRALCLAVKAQERKEELQELWKDKERKRLSALIEQIARGICLYPVDDDDGNTMNYILDNLVWTKYLVDFDDETIARAFSQRELYFELYETRAYGQDEWNQLIRKYTSAAADSA